MKKKLPNIDIFVSIFIGSCKKDECADGIDQKLDRYAVEAVPYETGQIIAFNTSNPDLINLSQKDSRKYANLMLEATLKSF